MNDPVQYPNQYTAVLLLLLCSIVMMVVIIDGWITNNNIGIMLCVVEY